jgi:uncharacterized protein (TIGR02246 family)
MNEASTERGESLKYPTNRVVGTVGDANKAQKAIEMLVRAGFLPDDIEILHDEADLRRLDAKGARQGVLAQFQWTWIRTFGSVEEFNYLTHYLEDIRAGRFVIMVRAKRRAQRITAADILNRHGAEFVAFYGMWAWEGLPASARNSPEDIPALFARAWNERDAHALASLFDEDAEFVNVTGVCWHDRESIRKAHAEGFTRAFDTATLAADAIRVKLLSAEAAVVHARMTLSGQPPDDGAAEPAPRTTIASFALHKSAERWLCASVHQTGVIPDLATPVAEEVGMSRPAGYPGDQLS